MNEVTFLIHVICILSFLLLSLKAGKEALCSFICSSWILANFFVTKQIVLFGWEVTASDVYVIGAMLGLSCLQEYWGKGIAKKIVYISFMLMAFATVSSLLHISYFQGPHDVMHDHFDKILAPCPRLAIASLICFLISQNCDVIIFQALKKFSQVPFSLRAFSSTCISQLIDTLLFSLLGLWGIVHSIFDIFIVSYSIKLIIIAFSSPFLTLCGYILPKEKLQNT